MEPLNLSTKDINDDDDDDDLFYMFFLFLLARSHAH